MHSPASSICTMPIQHSMQPRGCHMRGACCLSSHIPLLSLFAPCTPECSAGLSTLATTTTVQHATHGRLPHRPLTWGVGAGPHALLSMCPAAPTPFPHAASCSLNQPTSPAAGQPMPTHRQCAHERSQSAAASGPKQTSDGPHPMTQHMGRRISMRTQLCACRALACHLWS